KCSAGTSPCRWVCGTLYMYAGNNTMRHGDVPNVIEINFYKVVAQASLPVNNRLEACSTVKD
ncbi:MAG: hypothetical protein ACUZ8H_10030, partial [Candidatus Anammoxibacter sp.]